MLKRLGAATTSIPCLRKHATARGILRAFLRFSKRLPLDAFNFVEELRSPSEVRSRFSINSSNRSKSSGPHFAHLEVPDAEQKPRSQTRATEFKPVLFSFHPSGENKIRSAGFGVPLRRETIVNPAHGVRAD